MNESSAPKIRWQSRPGGDDSATQYRLVRTPANGALTFTILSHDMVGVRTHHWAGRTIPCTEVECPACGGNQADRWYGYVIGRLIPTKEICLVEFTPPCGKLLEKVFAKNRTMRGHDAKLFRAQNRPNGRVMMRILEQLEDRENLPKAPAIEPILLAIWGLRKAKTTKGGSMADHLVTDREDQDDGNPHSRDLD